MPRSSPSYSISGVVDLMLCSCVSLLAVLSTPAGLIAQEPALKDVNVQVRRPGEAAAFILSSTTIHAERATVRGGAGLDEPLRRRGIHPDAESYGALYQLNPFLRGPEPDTSVELLLPVLDGPDELRHLVATGYEAYLTTDFGLKQQIAGRIQALPKLERALVDVPPERFGGTTQKSETRAAVSEIRRMAVAAGLTIQGRARPLSHELLVELDGELTVTEAVINRLTGPGAQSLSPTDREALSAVTAQATLRRHYWIETFGTTASRTLDPSPTGKVLIYVCSPRLSAAPDTQPDTPCRGATSTAGLRIYYRDVAGYYGHLPPNSLPDLSPVQRELDVGNFFFWATKPNDSVIATDALRVEVREGAQPLRVELVLRKP